MRFAVRAHAGASRTGAEWDGAVLHVRVTAPAVDGAANRALIKAVAEALDIRRSAVRLVTGERSRQKLVEVDGVELERLEALRRPRPGRS